MRTEIGNNVFIIKFQYKTIENKESRIGTPITQRESICYIKHSTSQTESVQIVEASVKTDSRDSFVRSVGRSLAFKKAMIKMFADKTLREQFGLTNVEFAKFVSDFYNQCPSSAVV